MALAYAIIATTLFIIAIVSILLRESALFTDNDRIIKKRCLKFALITGAISSLLAWLNHHLWSDKSNSWQSIDIALVTALIVLVSVVCLFIMLCMWSISPSDSSKRKETEVHHVEYKQVNSFLKNYSIDKTMSIGNKKVSLSMADSVLLIYEDNNNTNYHAIPFKSIIECEILEDNSTIMSGGIGRAIVGAAVAGATGAIVGAATRKSKDVINSLTVRIITNEVMNPLYEIPVIDTLVNRNSDEYKKFYHEAQVVYSTVVAIINNK